MQAVSMHEENALATSSLHIYPTNAYSTGPLEPQLLDLSIAVDELFCVVEDDWEVDIGVH